MAEWYNDEATEVGAKEGDGDDEGSDALDERLLANIFQIENDEVDWGERDTGAGAAEIEGGSVGRDADERMLGLLAVTRSEQSGV